MHFIKPCHKIRLLKLFSSCMSHRCTILLSDPSRNQPQVLNARHITNYKKDYRNSNNPNSQIIETLISHKYLRLIKLAVRENGPITENNKKLAVILNKSKSYLPQDFINFAMRMSCDVRATTGLFDLFFSAGCHLVIHYEDIDTTITKHHLLDICNKYDGNLIQVDVKWQQSYNQKGIITVKCDQSDPISQQPKDKMLSTIKAESLLREVDAEGCEYWKVICDPWILHDVKKELNKITDHIEEAYVGFLPKEQIYLPRHVQNQIGLVFGELSKVPTIDNVFVNFNLVK